MKRDFEMPYNIITLNPFTQMECKFANWMHFLLPLEFEYLHYKKYLLHFRNIIDNEMLKPKKIALPIYFSWYGDG